MSYNAELPSYLQRMIDEGFAVKQGKLGEKNENEPKDLFADPHDDPDFDEKAYLAEEEYDSRVVVDFGSPEYLIESVDPSEGRQGAQEALAVRRNLKIDNPLFKMIGRLPAVCAFPAA